MAVVYVGTDQQATLVGVNDQNGEPVAGVHIIVEILNDHGSVLAPQPNRFPLTFSDANDGRYTAIIHHDHGLKLDQTYLARYTAVYRDAQSVYYGQLSAQRLELADLDNTDAAF